MEKITVFLADWQVLFREGIHFTLSGEEDMEVIGEDVDNEQALAFIETNPPRVAILNATHDKLNGFEATRQIKQTLPEVSIILVMDNYNEVQLFDALKSGASACFTKDVDPDIVVNTIREVAQGKQAISEVIWKRIFSASFSPACHSSLAKVRALNKIVAACRSSELR